MTTTEPTGATVTLAVEITPDQDGVHCGECDSACPYPTPNPSCRIHDEWITIDSVFGGYKRCPACLAAERRFLDAQAAKGGDGLKWHGADDRPGFDGTCVVKSRVTGKFYICTWSDEYTAWLGVVPHGTQEVESWAYLPVPDAPEQAPEAQGEAAQVGVPTWTELPDDSLDPGDGEEPIFTTWDMSRDEMAAAVKAAYERGVRNADKFKR